MLLIILLTYLLHTGIMFYKVDFPIYNILLFIFHTSLLINSLLAELILFPYLLVSLTLLHTVIIFICIILFLVILFLIVKILSNFRDFAWIETYLKDL